jgi:hypothetical protein
MERIKDYNKKVNSYEYSTNPNKINEQLDFTHRMANFNSFAECNSLNLDTDANLYGGDTVVEVDYNMLENAGR